MGKATSADRYIVLAVNKGNTVKDLFIGLDVSSTIALRSHLLVVFCDINVERRRDIFSKNSERLKSPSAPLGM